MKFNYKFTVTTLLALSIAILSACATTTTTGGAVNTDRQQMMLVSSEQLDKMGAETYAKVKTEAEKEGVLNKDKAMLKRVRTIASRIEPQTGIFRADAPAWAWEVNVINSNELNAYCLPGGKIMVYSGIINQLNLTDDEIAIVLGHEIAHAVREHSREQVSQSLAAQTAIGIGSAVLGLGESSANIAGIGYQALLATQFSRTHESEADRVGLELTARAGYDPHAGITMWEKMINANKGGKPLAFLSTHPVETDRIAQIQTLLPTVIPLYKIAQARN